MERAPASMSLRDEAALTRYFLWDITEFERSTHSAMVERMVMESSCSCKCHVCDGIGVLRTADAVKRHKARQRTTESWVKWALVVRGSHDDVREAGGIIVDEIHREWHTVGIGSICQICDGTGTLSMRRRKRHRCSACYGLSREERQGCAECLGTGYAMPDALPTAKVRTASSGEPDSDLLERYASVSRQLARIPAVHRRTIEHYYGVHGQSWAPTAHGRIHGLLEFTASGMVLLQESRRRLVKKVGRADEPEFLTNAERLATQATLQQTSPEQWRHQLLEAAVKEARQALTAATAAWIGLQEQPKQTEAEMLYEDIDATADAYEAWLDRNSDCWDVEPRAAS
jgi:hypothetical protein